MKVALTLDLDLEDARSLVNSIPKLLGHSNFTGKIEVPVNQVIEIKQEAVVRKQVHIPTKKRSKLRVKIDQLHPGQTLQVQGRMIAKARSTVSNVNQAAGEKIVSLKLMKKRAGTVLETPRARVIRLK